jgi:uncharacterized RDD family membrane protein YckC
MDKSVDYVGFWKRFVAFLVDSVLVSLLLAPIGPLIFGVRPLHTESLSMEAIVAALQPEDVLQVLLHSSNLLNYGLTFIAVMVFWFYRSATPGKIVVNAMIVDAQTLGKPSTGQFIGRYLGYFVSTIPLFLGLIWVAFDPRKQGWHDKLAGTVVIRRRSD